MLKVKEDKYTKDSGRMPRRGHSVYKGPRGGWQTLGELDLGTEEYQCGWNSSGGSEIGRGKIVVSCDPRLRE